MKHLPALFLSLALLLSACGTSVVPAQSSSASSVSVVSERPADTLPQQTDSDYFLTFTDDMNREISFHSRPERAAALIGSFADIWCLAGGHDTLVAAANDSWTSFDLNLTDSVTNLGAVKEPNLELLLSAEPDFVLASCNTDADVALADTLDSAGIPTAYFDVQNFEDYLRVLKICTDLTGNTDAYAENGTTVAEQVEAARAAVPEGLSPTVLCIRATGSGCKVKGSQDNLAGEMLADLGCVNIADSDSSLLENLSMEAILQDDPDFIFVVLQGSDPTDAEASMQETLLSDPAWNSLRAVKEGRFYTLENALYNIKPNARWGEAYEKLEAMLYE